MTPVMTRAEKRAVKETMTLIVCVAALVLLWRTSPDQFAYSRAEMWLVVTAVVAGVKASEWARGRKSRKWDEWYVMSGIVAAGHTGECYEPPPALVPAAKRLVRRGWAKQCDADVDLYELTAEGAEEVARRNREALL